MGKSEKKHDFLKTPITPDFDFLESNFIYFFVHENQKIYPGQ